MDSTYRIITHGGKAHMDELIASALVRIYKKTDPTEVLRIENRVIEEMLSEDRLQRGDWVLDSGCRLEPEKNVYDHHQDRDADSTALLVFDHLFPDYRDSRLHDYLKLLSRVDTRGIQSLNDFENLDESLKYLSFSQQLLLRAFERDPLTVINLIADVLQDHMEFDGRIRQAREWLDITEHTAVSEIAGVLVLQYLEKPPEELASALRAADKELVDKQNIGIVYSFDEKIEGVRVLFRTNHGHETVDFSRSRPTDLQFCHPAGFLLKFIPRDESEWQRLVRESML